MNIILRKPMDVLGYNFIPAEYLPKGKDEYHLRNFQNNNGIHYRKLSAFEIEVLVRNRNTSDDWNNILVSEAFNPELVKNCKFYGLVRIGKLEPYFLEFRNLRLPVGLYNSKIISCDLGDNVVIDNVDYISHYIIGSDVIIVNVHEVSTTDYAKFGNGIIKDGEEEQNRIWLEICNENGGRKVIPFNGMLPGDAFLWSRFREDEVLQNKLKEFTERKFDKQRGYYGKIGDRTVIKNCKILKDVWIGSDAYLKGANKLKNLTINSSADATSQIGEGCEMVNGIIGYGCKIFYGVKAVRFVMASHSQLKYGARLINSYLGNNATISCCEVLNSLIFPAHEQHHNNSFLCAAMVMGQSNMAAGATIGSNHNSRSADGEFIAGRGFWPGLCVSLKHNSQFASFTILAKGDYPVELNIPVPFCLVSNDTSKDQLTVMPGYWFMYNMYALARNAWKYIDRDSRIEKIQRIEYDYLAPDSINEVITSLSLLKKYTGIAFYKYQEKTGQFAEQDLISAGEKLLDNNDPLVNDLKILAADFENSHRDVVLIKVLKCYHIFKDLLYFYAVNQLLELIETNGIKRLEDLVSVIPSKLIVTEWCNVGGQLILKTEFEKLIKQIHTGKVKRWDDVHDFYKKQGEEYVYQKFLHSLAALQRIAPGNWKKDAGTMIKDILQRGIIIKEWMCKGIYESRAKDYKNPFRQMVYDSPEEMDIVIGKLEENLFIKHEKESLKKFKETAKIISKDFGL